jgi:hypothetical protein
MGDYPENFIDALTYNLAKSLAYETATPIERIIGFIRKLLRRLFIYG